MGTVTNGCLGCSTEGKGSPPKSYDFSVADNHTNETPLSSAPKHHLSSGMVISPLIFNFSPQNRFSHRTAPTQTPKMCTLEKPIFPYSQFERVIFLFIFLESSRTRSWKILIRNFESFEKFFEQLVKLETSPEENNPALVHSAFILRMADHPRGKVTES